MLLCRIDTRVEVASEEEELREDLTFYFMSPCQKYKARGLLPWKLGVQILKIAMVTTQVWIYLF